MQKPRQSKKSPLTGRKRVRFQINADPNSHVYLSGSFNNWNDKGKKLVDRFKSGEFATTSYLSPGKHEYKFVIDGKWQVDPECQEWVVNQYGTLNSVITVDK